MAFLQLDLFYLRMRDDESIRAYTVVMACFLNTSLNATMQGTPRQCTFRCIGRSERMDVRHNLIQWGASTRKVSQANLEADR